MDPHDRQISAGVSAEPWLAELENELDRVLVGDAQASTVHALRVAAGRLSVWLELGGRRALHDDLRWLRRSAATLRDIDVMLEDPRPPEWEALLRVQRNDELATLRTRLASTRPRALLAGLRCVPAPDVDSAWKNARRIARRVLRAGEKMSADEHDPIVVHHVRRRLRRLRYALEWMQTDSTLVKEIQDAFGEFNDSVVELHHLESHTDVHVPELELHAIHAQQDQLRATALELWAKHRSALRDLTHEKGR